MAFNRRKREREMEQMKVRVRVRNRYFFLRRNNCLIINGCARLSLSLSLLSSAGWLLCVPTLGESKGVS